MPLNKLKKSLEEKIKEIDEKGIVKRKESIIQDIKKCDGVKGNRYILKGEEDKEYIRMNSNSYLALHLNERVKQKEEEAIKKFGVGPGAVRFISGTYEPHKVLEEKVARFHSREDAIIFSSAYGCVVGTLFSLIDEETYVISDELNHNCIINGIRLSKPKDKDIYKHLDYKECEEKIKEKIGKAKKVLIITDGVFSMRGDYAPLDKLQEIANKYDKDFDEGVILIVDDSHGVGIFGESGRGTEEVLNTKVDILIGTFGKAFGVNGGYLVSDKIIVDYLREKAPFYIYTNPITPGEANAIIESINIIDSEEGKGMIRYVRELAKKFRDGIVSLGLETTISEHPIVPLIIRDTEKTKNLVKYLRENGVLSTGLNYPIVPKGEELIRFQVTYEHTEYDINYVLGVIKNFFQK
ncbi:MAG: aminotransferase class I/II-fold pyridoxal phosphate-dependent enzyme [Caldisericia bacterium]|jgi:glycine C-acetyltransferase|nr:aminotransferase class I/II-fold pyridoxal phosphate-dependent enzyme [Caldisericia bacterium]